MAEDKVKILLWAPLGAGQHYWGPGLSAYRLFSRASDGFEISLVHGNPEQKKLDLFHECICLGNLKKLNLFSLYMFLYKAKRWLSRNAHKYDIFFGLTAFEYTVRPAFHAEQLGLPTITKISGLRSGLESGKGIRSLLKLACRRKLMLKECSATIAISSEIASKLEDFGFSSNKIWRIPNGVDAKQFYPVRNEIERLQIRSELRIPDKFTILFIGGMSSRKQPECNLVILKMLQDEGIKNVQAVFVGPERETGYMNHFWARVEKMSLRGSVIWLDHNYNIAPYYQAADVFVLLSRHEGMSNALLEALSSGIPAIVSDVSGSRDLVVSGENGYIVDNCKAAMESVCSYLRDKAQHELHSRAAREHILRGFSYEHVWDELKRKILSLVVSARRHRDSSAYPLQRLTK